LTYTNGVKAEVREVRTAGGSYVPEGYQRTWYKNGKLQSESYYIQGVLNGPATMWYENGQKQLEYLIVGGKPEGAAQFWYENGNLVGRGMLRGGERDGVWTLWDEEGHQVEEMDYRAGMKHGRDVRWRADGSIEWERTYENGRELGASHAEPEADQPADSRPGGATVRLKPSHGDFKLELTRAVVSDNGTLPTALRMYRHAMGRFPTTEEGLKALIRPPADEALRGRWEKGGGPFVEKDRDLRDLWSNSYVYRCPGTHNPDGFDLYSCGPDGVGNTDDDITNWEK
jgi:general secretion pathway protein G